MTSPAQSDPTAVIGRRVVAAIIDSLVVFVPMAALIGAQFDTYVSGVDSDFCNRYMDEFGGACIYVPEGIPEIGERAYLADSLGPVPGLTAFLLSFGLLVVLQGLAGFTPGKLVTGIRTVREDGSAPGIGRAALRWALLLVDSLPCIPLVGFITALTSTGHRRVGDMAAKTFVVRTAAKGSPVLVPGLTAAPGGTAYAGPPTGWGAPPGQAGGWPASPPAAPPTTTDPTQAGWGSPTAPAPEAAPPAERSPWAVPGDSSPQAPEPEAAAAPKPAPEPEPAPEPPPAAAPEPDAAATPEPGVAPAPQAEPEPAAEPAAAAPVAPEPQWDEARGTYIQWDPAQQRWLQWDDAAKTWVVIPGQ